MFEERRLHPIALIKEIITNVRRNIVPIVVGLFSVFRALIVMVICRTGLYI